MRASGKIWASCAVDAEAPSAVGRPGSDQMMVVE